MEVLTACRIESLEVRICVDAIIISPTTLELLDEQLQAMVTRRWSRWKRLGFVFLSKSDKK